MRFQSVSRYPSSSTGASKAQNRAAAVLSQHVLSISEDLTHVPVNSLGGMNSYTADCEADICVSLSQPAVLESVYAYLARSDDCAWRLPSGQKDKILEEMGPLRRKDPK